MHGANLLTTSAKSLYHIFLVCVWVVSKSSILIFLLPCRDFVRGTLILALSVHPSVCPSGYFVSSQTDLIDLCFYRGVLNISDKFNIDLCVFFLNFDRCL